LAGLFISRDGPDRDVLRLYLLVPGVLLALAGFVFTLQGLGIVGPRSSFMFQSTAWIYDGLAILLVGVLLTVGGVFRPRPKTVG
jgi:hypothetical protein